MLNRLKQILGGLYEVATVIFYIIKYILLMIIRCIIFAIDSILVILQALLWVVTGFFKPYPIGNYIESKTKIFDFIYEKQNNNKYNKKDY